MTRILSALFILLLAAPSFAANVWDGLAEVNAIRAQNGLPPFIYDPNLARAAAGCVNYRAEFGIKGHITVGRGKQLRVLEYDLLPQGAFANATGCGTSFGFWNTCCTYENWTYAGAAWAIGRDGKKYMHIFVR